MCLFCCQIIHTDSNTVLGQNDTGFSCDGSASTFRVMFKEPVEVLPNVNYTACATLKVRRYSSFMVLHIHKADLVYVGVPYFCMLLHHAIKSYYSEMYSKRPDFYLCHQKKKTCWLCSSRVQTPTMALKACGRLPTSPQEPAPKPVSPSAMRLGTTTALPSRMDRSLRSSSTHNDNLVLPNSRSFGSGYK